MGRSLRHVPSGLQKIAAELQRRDKIAGARPAVPLTRAAGYGALAGVGLHAGNQLLSAASGLPTDPSDTVIGAASRSAAGGVAVAGLLNLLNRITSRR